MTTYTFSYTVAGFYSGWDYGGDSFDGDYVYTETASLFLPDTEVFIFQNGEPAHPLVDWFDIHMGTSLWIERIEWNGKTSYVYLSSGYYSDYSWGYYQESFTNLVVLGGDALPDFADYDAYTAFLTTATRSRDALGPYAEGGSLDPKTIPGASWTENDTVEGSYGDQDIAAGVGNDLFDEGTSYGADTLDGGLGLDTVTYASAPWQQQERAVVDLQFGTNAGKAAGDVLIDIENVIGTAFNDRLLGDAEDNRLRGENGNDWLAGRKGADLLSGGDGRDVLMGGPGGDTLNGGAGHDRANYMLAQAGLVADLAAAGQNTGEASGDIYVAIEGLIGSDHNDTLRGGAGDDMLFGRDGFDVLHGRDGNDQLFGMGASDQLNGGAGDDTLQGGAGADTFLFSGGKDVVVDLKQGVDALWISNRFASGADLSAADLLAAETLVDGTLVLDFGANDKIWIMGYTSVTPLLDDILGY